MIAWEPVLLLVSCGKKLELDTHAHFHHLPRNLSESVDGRDEVEGMFAPRGQGELRLRVDLVPRWLCWCVRISISREINISHIKDPLRLPGGICVFWTLSTTLEMSFPAFPQAHLTKAICRGRYPILDGRTEMPQRFFGKRCDFDLSSWPSGRHTDGSFAKFGPGDLAAQAMVDLPSMRVLYPISTISVRIRSGSPYWKHSKQARHTRGIFIMSKNGCAS